MAAMVQPSVACRTTASTLTYERSETRPSPEKATSAIARWLGIITASDRKTDGVRFRP